MHTMAQLCLEATVPQAEAAIQKSIISYFPPFEAAPPILISEAPQLLAAGSNVGLRTWDACLRLAYYLTTEGQSLIKDKAIIELGAGTGMLSILCANHLQADIVLATDGLPEIVTSMEHNIELNPPAQDGLSTVHAAHFEWSDTETLTQSIGLPSTRDWRKYDLVIGADITYNPEYFEPLVNALLTLLKRNEDTTILIAGAIRNLNTYNAFLETCSENNLEVLEVDYDCPGLHQQKGFFHAIALPIKIMYIRRAKSPKAGSGKARLDSTLGRFVAISD
jgi:predicted nicotinamide N-methyase